MATSNQSAKNKGSLNFPVDAELARRKQFSQREIGLNHPDTNSFLRLSDEGDIEIFAAPGVGIIISASSSTISFFAEKIRFFCGEDGLRWNEFNFNYSSSDYSQPTLVKVNPKSIHSAQNEAYHYLAKLKSMGQKDAPNPTTINEDYGFSSQKDDYNQKYDSSISTDGLSPEQISFINNILNEHSKEYLYYAVELMKQGYTNQQVIEKADKEKNV